MIDLHCHLDLYPRPEEVVARVNAEGVYVLAVSTTPLAWQGTNALVRSAQRVKVALGLHPELVEERHSEVEQFCQLVPQARYVGEIGLDGTPKHRHTLTRQCEVLDRILDACAEQGGRIMSLHSRGAVLPLLDSLRDHPGAGVPILHWFSGSHHELTLALKANCWFSVGPTMLSGTKGRRLAAAMPRERVLTETDGPFTRKVGQPLMPWDVQDAERALAVIWGIPVPEAHAVLLNNLQRLLTIT